jgi:hypothetical protein
MASVKGFEVKAIKGFRGHEGEPLQKANLYYENKKVGFLSDDANGGSPVIQVDEEYSSKWTEAITYFKDILYDEKAVASGEELFYFLLTVKEWERIVKQQLENGFPTVAILEEIEITHGYRTGAYKVFAFKSDEESESLKELGADDSEPTEWRKSIFHSIDDLNFQ